jgi:hypothetical protein
MQPVLELIERVGPSEANVLITGENGTGKGVVARRSTRLAAGEPALVTVNTGALSDTVFESELFGHVRGAFTDAKGDRVGRFEMADGGTLFLDEIANITAPSRPSSCGCSRPASSSGSARRARAPSTCASSRPPTPTSTPRSPPAASGRTSSSG